MTNICIDLGGTNIKAGIIKQNKIIISRSKPVNSNGDFRNTISVLDEFIDSLLVETGLCSEEITGFGLSIPGIIDIRNNLVLAINKKHEGAIDFNFQKWVYSKYNVSLTLENDARSALVGEWQYGAGSGFNNIVMVTLGTGVGGAAMIDGNLIYGKHYQAGCLGGHFTVNYLGATCTCGNIGCVEAEASSWNLKQLIHDYNQKGNELQLSDGSLDFEKLFDLYIINNKKARQIIDHCLRVWAAGIVSLIHAYDPEVVILSGGIMKSKNIIVPYVQKYVDQYAWTPSEKVRVNAAQSTEMAALQGINYLINKKAESKKR